MISLACASLASASTGQITRAYADQTWSLGSIAGSVTWTDCSGTCQWIPVATVQPTLPAYQCQGDEIFDSDPNTRQVWNAGGQTSNGTQTFDLTNVPILAGVQGQRLCLSVIEIQHVLDPVCVAKAPILGYDPSTCPLVQQVVPHVMATALLTLAPANSPPSSTSPVPTDTKAPVLAPPKGPSRISATGALSFEVKSNEAATGTATGTISLPKTAKTLRFKTAKVSLAAGKLTKITLHLPKRSAKAVRQALKHHRLVAKITLTVKDASANRTAKRLTLKLKR